MQKLIHQDDKFVVLPFSSIAAIEPGKTFWLSLETLIPIQPVFIRIGVECALYFNIVDVRCSRVSIFASTSCRNCCAPEAPASLFSPYLRLHNQTEKRTVHDAEGEAREIEIITQLRKADLLQDIPLNLPVAQAGKRFAEIAVRNKSDRTLRFEGALFAVDVPYDMPREGVL